MSSKKFEKFFVGLDIFGKPIGVSYKGSNTYQTRIGAFCTLISYVIMGMNLSMLIFDFYDHSNQSENINDIRIDPWSTD